MTARYGINGGSYVQYFDSDADPDNCAGEADISPSINVTTAGFVAADEDQEMSDADDCNDVGLIDLGNKDIPSILNRGVKRKRAGRR